MPADNVIDMAKIKARIEKRLKSELVPKQKVDGKKYILTGISGFDDLLERGIPKGKAVLIAGSPGTGKTIFCLQTIAYGCQKGEKCLYLSLEESEESLIEYMKDFGWDPEKWISNRQLIIKRLDPLEISKSLETKEKANLSTEISKLIPEGFSPDRLVLDSITAIAAAFAGKDEMYSIYIEQFFRMLEKLKTNSFLITETWQLPKSFDQTGEEEFLADGIVALYNFRKKNLRLRAVEILKLRDTQHENRIIPFNIIAGKGIFAYPKEEIYASMEKEEL